MTLLAPSPEAFTQELQETRRKTLVVGIGNPLQGDDGAGVRAAELLKAELLKAALLKDEALPLDVEIQELGTPGWGLVNVLQGWQRVILIDAVCMDEAPGTWRVFKGEEIRLVAGATALSLHEPGLAESLALAEALHLLPPETVLYAVEPAFIGTGAQLTAVITDALPDLVKHILSEIWMEK